MIELSRLSDELGLPNKCQEIEYCNIQINEYGSHEAQIWGYRLAHVYYVLEDKFNSNIDSMIQYISNMPADTAPRFTRIMFALSRARHEQDDIKVILCLSAIEASMISDYKLFRDYLVNHISSKYKDDKTCQYSGRDIFDIINRYLQEYHDTYSLRRKLVEFFIKHVPVDNQVLLINRFEKADPEARRRNNNDTINISHIIAESNGEIERLHARLKELAEYIYEQRNDFVHKADFLDLHSGDGFGSFIECKRYLAFTKFTADDFWEASRLGIFNIFSQQG